VLKKECVHEIDKNVYHYIGMNSQRNIKTYVYFSGLLRVEILKISY